MTDSHSSFPLSWCFIMFESLLGKKIFYHNLHTYLLNYHFARWKKIKKEQSSWFYAHLLWHWLWSVFDQEGLSFISIRTFNLTSHFLILESLMLSSIYLPCLRLPCELNLSSFPLKYHWPNESSCCCLNLIKGNSIDSFFSLVIYRHSSSW